MITRTLISNIRSAISSRDTSLEVRLVKPQSICDRLQNSPRPQRPEILLYFASFSTFLRSYERVYRAVTDAIHFSSVRELVGCRSPDRLLRTFGESIQSSVPDIVRRIVHLSKSSDLMSNEDETVGV